MKAVIVAAVLFCLALVGTAYYFATRDDSSGPRVVAIDASYASKQERGGWVRGAANPKVTIVEYADFQCPYCRAAYPILNDVLAANPDTVQLEYRHYPLQTHNKSIMSATASEAAGRQGKFWEMYELLYASQPDWQDQTTFAFKDTVEGYAKKMGLNLDQFKRDMKDRSIVDDLNKSIASGNQLSIQATPTLVVNGQVIDNGTLSTESLNKLVQELAAKAE